VKRVLALIPALILVIGLASAAQAGTIQTKHVECLGSDTSTTGVTFTVKWDDGGRDPVLNKPVYLLHAFTITNTCATHWALFRFFYPDHWETRFTIAPMTTRSVGRQGLEHIGMWQYPFRNWPVRASGFATGPCSYGGDFWIMSDGHITGSPC